MYCEHWGLQAKPFEEPADRAFYYPAATHEAALLKLRYALENGRPLMMLSGAPGLGKTMLVNALAAELDERFAPVARLVFPLLPTDQLLAWAASRLDEASQVDGRTAACDCLNRLEHALAEHARAGRRPLLVLDEAHVLSGAETWEAVRLLANFTHDGQPALSVLIVGQTPLLPAMERMPELDQRLAVKCLLRRLNPEETAGYVEHRMNAAGAARNVFEPGALEALHYFSHGSPRQINRLADLALLVGYAEERSSIGAEQVEAVADELVQAAPD